MPIRNVLQGIRISEAAQLAIETMAAHIALLDADYEALVDVLIDPRPSGRPMPPALARAVLVLLQALEAAESDEDGTKARPPGAVRRHLITSGLVAMTRCHATNNGSIFRGRHGDSPDRVRR